jgi:FkbM family methyltransferase
VIRRILRRLADRAGRLDLEKLGSDYGGWVVPTQLVRAKWICFCGGVGEDLTFDRALIERFGCTVHAFDPTPRAIEYVERSAAGLQGFHFMPVGLWSSDSVQRFYAPRDPSHVSHSVLNLQATDTYFEAACRSIPSLMAELGHERIDLLKLDIEGAEHQVLDSVIRAGLRPKVICTEIDQPVDPLRLLRTTWTIRQAGYQLVAVDGWNFTYVRHLEASG